MIETPLRQFRRREKLTLKQLSEQVGVTEGQLSRIEREGRTSFSTARKLAEATGLSLEEIAGAEAA